MGIPSGEYAKLSQAKTLVGLDESAAVASLAKLVDGSSERGLEEGLRHAINLGTELLEQQLSPEIKTTSHYCVSNAWAALHEIKHGGTDRGWHWKLPEIERQLRHLRLAANGQGFAEIVAGRRTQIQTNTGNLLSHLGRSCEAVAAYKDALDSFPGFAMAEGNRAIALIHLALAHYDSGQAYVILHSAYVCLQRARSKSSQLEPGAEECFKWWENWIAENVAHEFLTRSSPAREYSLGRSKGERAYREWSLANTLFLNPMNDAGMLTIAATDTVNMPSHVLGIGEGPGFFGLFNQIKQEYVAARMLYWEGMAATKKPFADRDVLMMDTLDYPMYGIAVEKQRIAFRLAYSVLDKVAFLLNKYFSLGIDDNLVNLNRVWFAKGNPKTGLSIDLMDQANWPLRGLFWLARDLFDERGLQDAVAVGQQIVTPAHTAIITPQNDVSASP